METTDPLTERLTGVMVALMKGSHSTTMDVASEFDLTLSQLKTLFQLDGSVTGSLAVNEIAERVHLSMPAAGRAIDALHKNGLVSRREDEVDRRIKRIALTDTGTDAITRIARARMAAVQRLVDALTPDERTQLDEATAVLQSVVSNHFPVFCAPGSLDTAAGTTSTPIKETA